MFGTDRHSRFGLQASQCSRSIVLQMNHAGGNLGWRPLIEHLEAGRSNYLRVTRHHLRDVYCMLGLGQHRSRAQEPRNVIGLAAVTRRGGW